MKPGPGISIIKGAKCRLSIDTRGGRPRLLSRHQVCGAANSWPVQFVDYAIHRSCLSLLNLSFNITYCAVVFQKSLFVRECGPGVVDFYLPSSFHPEMELPDEEGNKTTSSKILPLRKASYLHAFCVWIFRCKCTLV